MYKRSDIVAFAGKADASGKIVYHRMTCFTGLDHSKNPKEYSRHYVDEVNERSDVVGYAPAWSYSFDMEEGNVVHEIITDITDGEKTGTEAKISLVVVNLNKESATSGNFEAYERTVSVVPSGEGKSTDAYTYDGTFKASGKKIVGTATTTDEWLTCTFVASESI